MAKLFKKIQVLDTCDAQDGGWSFALLIDDVMMNGWFDPGLKWLKLWYKDTQIVLRGQSAEIIAKDLEIAMNEYKYEGLKSLVFNYD